VALTPALASARTKSCPCSAKGAWARSIARDTKLNLDVALKILPEAFALDGDRIARFRREAQVLAALNHPNIAAITASRTPAARTRSSWNSWKA
jgi:hypothetical protein